MNNSSNGRELVTVLHCYIILRGVRHIGDSYTSFPEANVRCESGVYMSSWTTKSASILHPGCTHYWITPSRQLATITPVKRGASLVLATDYTLALCGPGQAGITLIGPRH